MSLVPAIGTTGELRWGILGCGKISGDFTQALTLYSRETNVIAAVATSDSLERAQDFLRRYHLHEHFGAEVQAYGSYEQLLNDARVDVVYVGVLNHQHKAAVLAALSAGKHVLCEKPMGVNAREVTEMVKLARRQRLFLMEAYWSRFFPAWQAIPQALREMGGAECVVADFGCAIHGVNKTELSCGGGFLLATGCYLPMLASWVFGSPLDGKLKRPTKVSAVGQLGEKATDVWANVTLEYDGGAKQAALFYTGLTATPCSASISGPHGSIHMLHDFWSATHMCITQRQGREGGQKTMEKRMEEKEFLLPVQKRANEVVPWAFDHGKAPGMAYEADHVFQCIKRGKLESAVMPLDESIILAEISDEVRRQLGVHFRQDGEHGEYD